MTTAAHFGPARPYARPAPERTSAKLGRFVDIFRRWLRMRRALAELRELDDRLLDDIGLCRSTLYAAARERHGFGNRSRHDSRAS